MENEKFQEFMGEQFSKLFKEVEGLKTNMAERFDRVEEQIAKLGALDHGDIEKVARQVEQLIVGQEALQDDMDYLLRRSLRKKG